MHITSITQQTLQEGIRSLFRYRAKTKKSGRGVFDFDNALYRSLEGYRRNGLNTAFWEYLVPVLRKWSASRPFTDDVIRNGGLTQLTDLQRCFQSLMANGSSLPHIAALRWDDVSPLFERAIEIKPTSTPSAMFASKVCHFLVPSAYVITDGKLVQQAHVPYRDYWEACQHEWRKLNERERQDQIDQLRQAMPKACIPCQTYPWATKIVELCQFK